MNVITEVDRAWAAGLYEGEGSCGMSSRNYPRIALGMTDQDVVERFREVLGVGAIHVSRRPERKDMYRFECGGWKHVQMIRDWMAPYLFVRRMAQLDTLLARRPIRPTSPTCEIPSAAGYRRHLRLHEPACGLCRRANTEYERLRRGDRPRYSDGSGYL